MRGKHVVRKGGWDCHGLPVEVEVEKELGFSAKHEIEDYGIERFNAKCRSSVQRYVEDWQSLTSRIGMWLDTAGAYWTLSNEYIESVWWLFHEMWDKDAIYEGYKVVPYCGRCGTALSSHELGQPGAYRDVTEPSVYVRFPLVDRDVDLLVWTTTPWTLPSNVGAAIGPHDRLRARARARRRARSRAWRATASPPCSAPTPRSSAESPSTDLVGARYEPPFTLVPVDGDAFRVVADDFVTVDDGSGIVHLAPAFGEIDREVGEREGLPIVNPVNDAARFTAAVGAPYAGKFVKDADPDLIDALTARGQARRGRRLHALVPALLALRHAAHLLGQAHVVRAHVRAQGRAAARERDDQLVPRAHQARPLRRLAREQRRLGALPRPLLGHADPGVALRRLRPRHVHRLGRRALGALRPRPHRHGSAPPLRRRRHDRVPGVRAGHRDADRAGARRVVRLRVDARRAVPLPVREHRRVRRSASPPTSSARRSTRRAAGSTRCSR